MDAAAWNDQDHGMHHSTDDDIQQFLDMNSMGGFPDGLQFDFGFQPQNGVSHLLQRETLDTPMSGTDAAVIMATTMHDHMPALTSAPLHAAIPSALMPSQPAPGDAISEIDAQIQFLQAQKLQQQQRQLDQQQQQHEQQRRQLEQQQAAFFAQQQSRIVPATPQSLEMRAGDRPYHFQPDHTPQPQQDIYEHFHMKEQLEMSFTPLVSPAVTPLESQFPIDQAFAVPSTYFSPLTSPALHAQSDPLTMLDRAAMGTNTSSPEDMDLETHPPTQSHVQPQNVSDLTKKLRKGSASKSRGKASVGKSPITKPLRKKTGSTPLMNAQALSELADTVEQQPQPIKKVTRLPEPSSNASNSSAAGITDSENSSVSPETLSDMPPPPLPLSRSAKPSPAIHPQNMATPTMGPHLITRTGKHSPATPASLMKLPSPSNANRPDAVADSDVTAAENIESFELPESVSSNSFQKPALTPLITRSPSLRSPALESAASRSSAFQPLPSPVFAKPGKTVSLSGSPQLVAGSSATNTPNLRKTPQLAPRTSKKRASISSSHVSPALRPKISPNIKPLLPGGVTAEDTASRLLASKSNYQNILEGNLVPGVSYPSELSTNLTSKRTSHKIAEQGRRNRINSALQEIATLLPGGALLEAKDSEAESGDKKDSKNGGTPNSKASTVELAIEYIKQLRQEVAEANKRAEEAEKKLEDQKGVSTS
ncbi:helix-loop-helix DNA-binding domain-domain-containing protein [Coniella lustricola]|uniref:Helix-loop-helix DNA-binding domain-domain-containing protein n=1 Tax=Coniella lustricola TaxID=2025994 RepID=A0A2T3ACG2_9PEZI|nr:helix-loop-helix DNA-binding domain-domain-containing protein [Coniella lustricola]